MPKWSVTLALDWTPNTNHVGACGDRMLRHTVGGCSQQHHLCLALHPCAGFYVAKRKGYYSENGIDVTFISAHEDGFTTLPAERIDRKEATFGIAPSETVISYNVRPCMKVGSCVAQLSCSMPPWQVDRRWPSCQSLCSKPRTALYACGCLMLC